VSPRKQLCYIDPTLNGHPQAAPSFLEADHFAENDNALAVRTVPESDLRNAQRITRVRFFRIEAAVDVTTVTLKIIRGPHALFILGSSAAKDSNQSSRAQTVPRTTGRSIQSRCVALGQAESLLHILFARAFVLGKLTP
jgi:hypothetical protein